MTVSDLIRLLEKVQHKEAKVYVLNSNRDENMLSQALIEHNLRNDEIVVILK